MCNILSNVSFIYLFIFLFIYLLIVTACGRYKYSENSNKTQKKDSEIPIAILRRQIYHIIYLFAQKYTRNSKCQHAVAELDGQGSNGALTVAYKIKMEYNMNK